MLSMVKKTKNFDLHCLNLDKETWETLEKIGLKNTISRSAVIRMLVKKSNVDK